MSNVSYEEAVQRLQNLLEQNSRITILADDAEGTTIQAGSIEFTIPRTTPSTTHQSISRTR